MKIRILSAIFMALLFISSEAAAELSARSRVLPASITIGGEAKVYFEVHRPSGTRLIAPSENLKVNPFEVKVVRMLEPKLVADGYKDVVVLIVTTFELGDLTFPSVVINYEEANGARGSFYTKPIKIKVTPVTKPADKKIKPIKDILPADLGALRALAYGAAALVLAGTLAALIYRRRRGEGKKIDPETLKLPHERAFLELGRLEKKPFLEEGRKKDYYGGLSQILKTYLGRQFDFAALDLTTSEILAEVKGGPMDELARRELKQFLDEADLVKFANFSPSRVEADRSTERVKEIVRRTTPEPAPKEASK